MQTRPRRMLGATALAVIAGSATITACDGSTAAGPTAAASGSNRAPSDPAPGVTAAAAELTPAQGGDASPAGSATPAPVPAPRRPTQDPAPVADGASLTCELHSFADRLELTYRVREEGGREAWVLDALPDDQKPASRREDPIYLAWSERAAALRVVQGIAPLPPDRLVEVRVIPFATRLAPRATLERTVRIPLPVRETGPYDPPDPSFKTRSANVKKLVLDVHLLRSDLAGFESKPWPHLAGTHHVRSTNVAGDARRVTCELAIPPINVFFAPRGFTRVE